MSVAIRDAPHRDSAPVLELLNELVAEDGVGIDDPRARATLETFETGKARSLAQRLLVRSIC